MRYNKVFRCNNYRRNATITGVTIDRQLDRQLDRQKEACRSSYADNNKQSLFFEF